MIDGTSLREHCCQMLRDAGHQVRGTYEGSIGVELLRACNFDVVLTSTAVGDLHGAGLIQSIAELQNSPSILVMSWYSLILEELAAAHLDIAATIWKFELPEMLLPVLKRVLLAR
ncbi:MAG TPA: response regulator [Polyangiales bacterium]|nr:response regulator [Polyangiales bacterium]